MVLARGDRFRLSATPEQETLFGQYAGVCRFVYNLALEQRRGGWRLYQANTGCSISHASQCRELTALRAEADWIVAVSVICQQQALRDLDRAFGTFFAGIAGSPTPRKRGENDAFRFNGRDCSWRTLNAKWGAMTLPRIGAVKFRLTRAIPGAIRTVTITRDDLGWHVVFTTAVEAEVTADCGPAVGLDRGVVHTIALSDGTLRDIDRERLNMLDRRARKHQRALCRKQRGSSRRATAKRRLLARTRGATAARLRKHWNHERSREMADTFGVVVLEDLNTKGMTASARGTVEQPGRNVRAKAGLNRVTPRLSRGEDVKSDLSCP